MATVKQEYTLEVVSKGLKEIVREIKALRSDMAGVSGAADKVSSGLTKTAKSAGEYDRNMKGAAKATNNSTKSFSKMAQGMQGTLVPAYATVAANVFALTAAFGALERAADTQILIKASEELAAQTGRSLTSVSKNMKEITGNAISMKEALTSASIAASAGFDNSTIEELTQVARNASIALGRDMTDSLNRVFKGAIKAEPELLDELGIILRLDPATREYAASIGKAVSELTTFEKQQAVVNAVLEQGQEKFGRLADVDPNPYTQLAAAFADVSNKLIALVGVPISPVIKFFSENTEALTAALVIFANKVIKSAIPALSDLGASFQNLSSKKLTGLSNAIEGYTVFTEILADKKLLQRGKGNIKGILNDITIEMSTFNGELNETTKRVRENFDKIMGSDLDDKSKLREVTSFLRGSFREVNEEYKVVGDDMTTTADSITSAMVTSQLASSKSFRLIGDAILKIETKFPGLIKNVLKFKFTMQSLSVGAFTGFISGFANGFEGVAESVDAMKEKINGAKGSLVFFQKTILGTTKVLGYLGAAFGGLIKWIPLIGQLVVAWQLLSGAVTWLLDLFRDGKAIESTTKALEDQTRAIETSVKSTDRYIKTLKNAPKTLDNVTKSLETQKNILQELNTANKEIVENSEGFGFLGADIDDLASNLNTQLEVLKQLGAETEVNTILEKFAENEEIIAENAIVASAEITKLTDKMLTLATAGQEFNETISKSFKDLNDASKEIAGTLPSLNGIQKSFLAISDILRTINLGTVIEQASRLSTIGSYTANLAGISDQIDGMSTVLAISKDLAKSEVDIKAKIEETNKVIEKRRESLFEAAKAFITGETGTGVLEKRVKILEDAGTTSDQVLSRVNSRLGGYVKEAITGLTNYANKLREVSNAQIKLAKETDILNFKLSLPGVGITERLELQEKLAKTQINASSTIIAQSTEAAKAIKNVNSAAQEIITSYEMLDKAAQEAYREDEERYPKLVKAHQDVAAAKLQELQITIMSSAEEQKIFKAKVSLLNKYRKELDEVTKASALDISSIISEDDILNKIGPLLESISSTWISSKEDVVAYREEVISAFKSFSEFQRLQTVTGGISAGGISGQNTALQDRIRALQLEGEYLRVNDQLIDQRIDKEFLLADAITQRRLDVVQSSIESGELSKTDLTNALELERQLYRLLETSGKAALELVKSQITQDIKRAQINIDAKNKELALGLRITNAAKAQLDFEKQVAILNAQNIDKESDLYNQRLKTLKEERALTLKIDIKDQLGGALDSISNFSDITKELRENIQALGEEDGLLKFQAGLLAINKIAVESGDKPSIALSQLGILTSQFGEDMKNATKDTDKTGLALDFASSAMGAFAGAMDDGSQAAEVFKLAQMALATVQAVSAVLNQGAGTNPYESFARMAAMAASVAALLSQADIAFSSSGTGGGGAASQAEAYKSSISSYGVVGGQEMQTNVLDDSINRLIDINAKLFSAERKLQQAVVDLGRSFDKVGAAIFGQAGSFDVGNILDVFGVLFQTSFDPGFFGDETTSNELVGAGIQFGATVEFIAGELAGQITDASTYLLQLITETDTGFFGIGGGSDTTLFASFRELDDNVSRALQESLDSTLNTIVNAFTVFGSGIIDIQSLFSNLEKIVIDTTQLDLVGKSAAEQASVIAAFFSDLSNDMLADLVPWLRDFSVAGEELTDTLVRLVEQTTILEESFSTIGSSLLESLGLSALQLEQAFDEYIDIIFNSPALTEGAIDAASNIGDTVQDRIDAITAQITELENATLPAPTSSWWNAERIILWQTTINNQIAELNTTLDGILDGTVDNLESFKLSIMAQWQEALLSNFLSTEDYREAFTKFSEVLFSPEELAEIARTNAEQVVTDGLTALKTQLLSLGIEDIAAQIGENIDVLQFQDLYNTLNEQGQFAVKIDEITGEFDTTGAELYGTIIQIGAALQELQEATVEVEDAISTFLRDIQREIDAFGLQGKELDLLQLDFNYEDAVEEARRAGEGLAEVEILYGLKRVDILRQYNQEAVDALAQTRDSIADAVLGIRRELESWDEVEYQTNLIDDLWNEFNSGLEGSEDLIAASVAAYTDAINTNFERAAAQAEIQLDLDVLNTQLAEANANISNLDATTVYSELNLALSAAESDLLAVQNSIAAAEASMPSFTVGTEAYFNLIDSLVILYDDATAAYAIRDDIVDQLEQFTGLEAALIVFRDNIANDLDNATAALRTLEDIGYLDIPDVLSELDVFPIEEQIRLIEDLKTAIIDKYNAEKQTFQDLETLAFDISDFIKSLAISDLSPLTNAERLAEAQNQFADNLRDLNSEDEAIRAKAQDNLTESASTFLEAGSQFYGISQAYQDIYDYVTSSLMAVQASFETTADVTPDALAINALQEETIAQLQVLDDILYSLEQQNNIDYQVEIEAWALAIGGGSTLDSIVLKLESLEEAVWATTIQNIPTYQEGTSEVEFDQIAKVHKGEMILTPSTSEDVRSGEAYITNINNTNTEVNQQGPSNEEVVNAIRVLTEVLASSQEDIIEQGERLLIQGSEQRSVLPSATTTRIL